MKLIVITHPDPVPDESRIIRELFEEGLECLHLRKPDYSEAQIGALLSGIGPEWHDRISLHQHHQVADHFGIRRLHFSEDKRNATPAETILSLKQQGYTLSTSIHSSEDLAILPDPFDYVFLGPVFDSISKAGYESILQSDFKLNKYGKDYDVIALGGITASNVPVAHQMGFDGVAALGVIWQSPDHARLAFHDLPNPGLKPGVGEGGSSSSSLPRLKPGVRISSLRYATPSPGLHPWEEDRSISRLHFISSQTPETTHLESIEKALSAGCKWIQLRVKNQAEEQVHELAAQAKILCEKHQAKLIINDFPNVALAVGAYGLHLGLTDMPVPQARAIVGDEMVIGGTANTFRDIALRIQEGADYIGLGPFRFTTTKQNLSPLLGLEGYQRLIAQMNASGHAIPIIAIGGIVPTDIPALLDVGVHGVAMSSALVHADDPAEIFNQIQTHYADHRR
ncbi:thiamine phosphate synthase [Dyadobacter sp. MSC1_007]|jgi:thiamine-phosphate diphosphorylase|uniref:thiamine phosphate synthase n=1 Tax=Dyadobacter sp. MSC1_007 TaxID=2909264 RepID=UPI002030476A|nr:thiamine phosphate synthase [Dyadobacter sp. MSC1_007]